MKEAEIYKIVNDRRTDLGLTQAEVSRRAFGRGDTALIQHLRRGKSPTARTLRSLCHALGLEFYIGPPRDGDAPTVGSSSPDRPYIQDGLPDSRPMTLAKIGAELADMSVRLESTKAALEKALAVGPANDGDVRPVAIMEVESAAGGGSEVCHEDIKGYAWFSASWLDDQAIEAGQCLIIGVQGESMEPTLMDGSTILVDRSRHRSRAGHIYVIRTEDGLVTKRLAYDQNGSWILTSDHPQWLPVPWNNNMEIIGQVLWTARTLPT